MTTERDRISQSAHSPADPSSAPFSCFEFRRGPDSPLAAERRTCIRSHRILRPRAHTIAIRYTTPSTQTPAPHSPPHPRRLPLFMPPQPLPPPHPCHRPPPPAPPSPHKIEALGHASVGERHRSRRGPRLATICVTSTSISGTSVSFLTVKVEAVVIRLLKIQ